MEQELEILIDEYLDGRMDGPARQRFERRMETDPQIREKVSSATRSVELIQQALSWATPDEQFDSKVTSRIQAISQSDLTPVGGNSDGSLKRNDPEARLLTDPAAEREKRRLLTVALITAAVFAATVCAIVYFILHGKS